MANIDKIITLEQFKEWKKSFKGKIVVTNGVFDLLHPGHMEYLEEASDLGDALVIALNSDSSVKELKDPRRPIISEEERSYMLASLACVSKVVLFQEREALNTLLEMEPDIYVKGGDYNIETINQDERHALEEKGTEIKILRFKAGFSTTKMIEKIINAYG